MKRPIPCSLTAAAVMTFGTFAFSTCAFGSGLSSPNFRIGVAGDKFSGTRQIAAAFDLPAPRVFRARNLEFAVGTISTSLGNEAFVSVGPVWRLPINNQHFFVDLGISPTVLSGSRFNGRDLGGNFHFTSSVSFGAALGRNRAASISLRIQHTSNGGLKDTNPGMDMIGINFSFGTN